MDGWMDGRMNGWIDKGMEKRNDGWMTTGTTEGNLRFKTTVNDYGWTSTRDLGELFCACVKVLGWRFDYRRVSPR